MRNSGEFGVMVDGVDTHLDVAEDSGLFSVYDDGDAIAIDKPKSEAEAAIEECY